MAFKFTKIIGYDNYRFQYLFKNVKTKSLFFSLGTKLGVGSIVGTVICIIVGGYGSILWLWLFTLIVSSLVYFEAYIGVRFRSKKENYIYSGPYLYISRITQNRILPIITSIILILTYSYFFMIVQINTIKLTVNINIILLTSIIVIILVYLLFFAENKFINIFNKLVVLMCLLIIVCAAYIIVNNFSFIHTFFKLVFTNAFSKKGLSVGLLIAVKRSVFLNEIMIGTTSVASGIEDGETKSICYTQVLGCYFIGFIISSLIAFIVILYLYNNPIISANYIDILKNAFYLFLGLWGLYLFKCIIILLSVTTIMSGIYIGLSTIKYIWSNNYLILFFKLFMLLFCIGGLFISTRIMWLIIDTLTLFLVAINIYAFYRLMGEYYDR